MESSLGFLSTSGCTREYSVVRQKEVNKDNFLLIRRALGVARRTLASPPPHFILSLLLFLSKRRRSGPSNLTNFWSQQVERRRLRRTVNGLFCFLFRRADETAFPNTTEISILNVQTQRRSKVIEEEKKIKEGSKRRKSKVSEGTEASVSMQALAPVGGWFFLCFGAYHAC